MNLNWTSFLDRLRLPIALLSVAVAASAAVSVGGFALGASIGSASASNLIGWTLLGAREPAEVQAYVTGSSITAADNLSVTATATQASSPVQR